MINKKIDQSPIRLISVPSRIIDQIKASEFHFPTTHWAVFENQAMDSNRLGHRQYIAYGPDNTYKEPPTQCPDTQACGFGWKYRYIGDADLIPK